MTLPAVMIGIARGKITERAEVDNNNPWHYVSVIVQYHLDEDGYKTDKIERNWFITMGDVWADNYE